MELAGQALGFPIKRVTKRMDRNWARKEVVQYWTARRTTLLQQYAYAREKGERESKADVEKAIRSFNTGIPDRTFRISGMDKSMSYRRRKTAQKKVLRGRPTGRMGRGIHKDFESAWEENSP